MLGWSLRKSFKQGQAFRGRQGHIRSRSARQAPFGPSGTFLLCLALSGLFFGSLGVASLLDLGDRDAFYLLAGLGLALLGLAIVLWIRGLRRRARQVARQQTLGAYASAARALAESPKLIEADAQHVGNRPRKDAPEPEA
jgi:hypothetical protein